MIIIIASRTSLSMRMDNEIHMYVKRKYGSKEKQYYLHNINNQLNNVYLSYDNLNEQNILSSSLMIKEPQYQFKSAKQWIVLERNEEGRLVEVVVDWMGWSKEKIHEILFIGDQDKSYSFQLLKNHYFPNVKEKVIFSQSLQDHKIMEDLLYSESYLYQYQQYSHQEKIKRYFDYLFNINSIRFVKLLEKIIQKPIKEILTEAKEKKKNKYHLELILQDHHYLGYDIFSKYMIQFLLAIQEKIKLNTFYTEGEWTVKLMTWKGTQKYMNNTKSSLMLGSSQSISKIISNCIDLGIIHEVKRKDDIKLTSIGEQFLNQIPSNCYDPDLPFKMEQWSHMELLKAKKEINDYLHHFFAKL